MTSTGQLTGYGRPVLNSVTDGPLPRLRKFIVPKANRHLFLRDGSVGFNLVHFAMWWNDNIHQLNAPKDIWDEWGWSPRPVRGQSVIISEHAAGAAMDLDATRHPRGVPILRTFTDFQTMRINRRLKNTFEGVIGWGGNYHHTVDGMHFEWSQFSNLVDHERVARKLLETPRGKQIIACNPGLRSIILS